MVEGENRKVKEDAKTKERHCPKSPLMAMNNNTYVALNKRHTP